MPVTINYKKPPKSWMYKGLPFKATHEEILQMGCYAFTYVMTFIPTGQMYIGKKVFISRRTVKPLKGKKRARIVYKSSGWEDYYSSSKVIEQLIRAHGTDSFDREIIALHPDKRGANIHELQLQIIHNVLDAELPNGERMYLNENIDRIYYPTKDPEERKIRLQLFKETMENYLQSIANII